MKILKWSLWDDEYTDMWYKNHHCEMSYTPVEENIVIEQIRAKGYKFPGAYHQNGAHGVPYLDNGKIFMVTPRHWGQIMAKAYPEEFKEVPMEEAELKYEWFNPGMQETYVYP